MATTYDRFFDFIDSSHSTSFLDAIEAGKLSYLDIMAIASPSGIKDQHDLLRLYRVCVRSMRIEKVPPTPVFAKEDL